MLTALEVKPSNKAGCNTTLIIFPTAGYHHCDILWLNFHCFQLCIKQWCSHKSRELLIDGECNRGISHAHMCNLSHEKNLSIRKSKSLSWVLEGTYLIGEKEKIFTQFFKFYTFWRHKKGGEERWRKWREKILAFREIHNDLLYCQNSMKSTQCCYVSGLII